MTLNGYLNSLDEMSCSDGTDPEGILDYIERWEARQTKHVPEPGHVAVETAEDLHSATREEFQDDLEEEMPDLFENTKRREQKKAVIQKDLTALVNMYQRPHSRHGSEQLRYYKYWRANFIRSDQLPDQYTLTRITAERLLLLFPQASNFTELAILFGFADQLPADQQDSELIKRLQGKGFHYAHECLKVQEDHDKVLLEVVERRAAKIAGIVANIPQENIDEAVMRARRKIHDEEIEAYWARRREQEAKAKQAQEAERIRRQNYDKRSSGQSTRTTTTTQQTYHGTTGSATVKDGFISSLCTSIGKIVDGVLSLVGELLDETYPGGEPK